MLLEIKSKIHRNDTNKKAARGRVCVNSTHTRSDTSERETSTNRLTFKQDPCSNGDANPCRSPGQMGCGSHGTQVASTPNGGAQMEQMLQDYQRRCGGHADL